MFARMNVPGIEERKSMRKYFQAWALVIATLVPIFFGATPVQAGQPGGAATPTRKPITLASLSQIHLLSIADEDIDLLRDKPSTTNLRAVYARYKATIDDVLPWDLDEDGLSLVFATLVAYQAAPYGAEDGPVDTLKNMFALSNMECRGYSLLVAKLFRKLQLGNRWSVYLHGFDGAKFIGNHAQVIAVDTTSGVPGSTKKSGLVLDPMVGIVAKVTLDALPLPTSPADVFVLGQRKNADISTISDLRGFRLNVARGLTTRGTYDYKKMIYQEDTSVFLQVGTLNPNLKTVIGVVGRTLYVLPDGEADTSQGVWQEFYTYNGYSMYSPYDPSVVPYLACDAPAPGRQRTCACFSNTAIVVPWAEIDCRKVAD